MFLQALVFRVQKYLECFEKERWNFWTKRGIFSSIFYNMRTQMFSSFYFS